MDRTEPQKAARLSILPVFLAPRTVIRFLRFVSQLIDVRALGNFPASPSDHIILYKFPSRVGAPAGSCGSGSVLRLLPAFA